MKGNAFLSRGFGDARDRAAAVRSASRRSLDPALLELLRAQNETGPGAELRKAAIDRLARGNAAVVITGQQVGLFLGPLYTLYKAASAVAIAKALTLETGVDCLPLFWLQTEDHDFPEIAGCSVPVDLDPQKTPSSLLQLRLHDSVDPIDERRSIGDRKLGAEVPSLLDQLENALEGLPHLRETIDCLRTNYREGVAPGEAFAGVLKALFAEHGLLVLDPRCSAVAKLAAPIVARALTHAESIDALLKARGDALREAGFSEQIEPRPGSPLCFVHVVETHGARYRLTAGKAPGSFVAPGLDQPITTAALLEIHAGDPLRFSTSALLRPLVQDSLLPTAVYVGGPAEVNYFAQLEPLYRAFEVPMPLIAERAHARLVPRRIRLVLEKLGLRAGQLDLSLDQLLPALHLQGSGDPARSLSPAPGAAWSAELDERLARYGNEIQQVDPSLAKAAARLRGSVERALAKLQRKHQRSALARDQGLRSQVDRLQGFLRPHGEPQERVLSFPAFAARVGMRELTQRILSAIGTGLPDSESTPAAPGLHEIDL
jgi:bacillithiol biosynthesis cysteine-adding enzyme BshC